MEHYERLRVLGRGSNGVAHLARRRQPGADEPLHVIKEIELGQMQPAARRQAQNEAEVLRSLSHINIVAHVATFLEASRLFIVMEFADGGDLSAAIHQRRAVGGRFCEREATGIFAQCCLGLQHAHSRHVLHRDLKSQNIFLTKGGLVKVGDFGIAVVLDHTTHKVKTIVGSPAYTPPEVCDNRPYGLKADVWSLGVVMYELLALELPFQAESLATLVQQICQGEPRPLSESYSPMVKDVVQRALRKRPEERPSFLELLQLPRLRAAVAQLPASPPPERRRTTQQPPVVLDQVGKPGSAESRPRSMPAIQGDGQMVAPPPPQTWSKERPACAYDADFTSFAERMLSHSPTGRWGSSGSGGEVLCKMTRSAMATRPKDPQVKSDPSEVVDEILDLLEL